MIGFAAADIAPGTFVHSHNMEFREFDRDYAHARDYRPVELLPESERASFMGIVRENGQVATRNYIGVTGELTLPHARTTNPSVQPVTCLTE